MTTRDEQQFADHESALLRDLDAAMGQFASGGYDIYVSCGCDSPKERLLPTPAVQTCIACQERIEKEHGGGRADDVSWATY